jgi:hypothetical protein
MAEKVNINLSNGQTKSSDEQFLKPSPFLQSFSALVKIFLSQFLDNVRQKRFQQI